MTKYRRFYEAFGLWERTHPETGEVYLYTRILGITCYVLPNPNKYEPKQPQWLFICDEYPGKRLMQEAASKFAKVYRRKDLRKMQEADTLRLEF